jgi:3-methyladenine DNA glycosylase Mpg
VSKRTRSLAAYQRARRQEQLADTTQEVAVLEGQLMAALGLDLQQIAAQVYGPDYHTPDEKLNLLLAQAARVGV